MYNMYISYSRMGYNTDTNKPYFYEEEVFCGSVNDENLDDRIEQLDAFANVVNGYVWFEEF